MSGQCATTHRAKQVLLMNPSKCYSWAKQVLTGKSSASEHSPSMMALLGVQQKVTALGHWVGSSGQDGDTACIAGGTH